MLSLRERSQTTVSRAERQREKPGTDGERETRYLWHHFSPDSNRTWNHLPWALKLQEPVAFPLYLNCFGWVFFFCSAKNPNECWIFPECCKQSLLWYKRLWGRAPCLIFVFPVDGTMPGTWDASKPCLFILLISMANGSGILGSAALASPCPARLESAF